MFNKLISSLALIAIGYGLKAYVDEYGIFDDDTDEPSPTNENEEDQDVINIEEK